MTLTIASIRSASSTVVSAFGGPGAASRGDERLGVGQGGRRVDRQLLLPQRQQQVHLEHARQGRGGLHRQLFVRLSGVQQAVVASLADELVRPRAGSGVAIFAVRLPHPDAKGSKQQNQVPR